MNKSNTRTQKIKSSNHFTILGLPLILILFITTNTYSQSKDWVKYSSDEGNVKISFPCQYEVAEMEKDYGKTFTVKGTSGDDFYYLAFTLHDEDMSDAENLALISLESFSNELNGEIVQQEKFTEKKQTGVKAKILLEDGSKDIYYRAIISGQVQYQLIVIDASKSIEEDRKKFFDSFKILK